MVQPWDTTKAGDSSTNTDTQEVTPKMISKFEFVDNNRYDILKTLRGILRHFEDVPAGNRAAYPSRYQGEVNEADIQEISMPELCHMMGASVDKVYEALVAGDYIEEIVNTA